MAVMRNQLWFLQGNIDHKKYKLKDRTRTTAALMPCESKRWANMQVEINKQNQYFKWSEAVMMLRLKMSVKISTRFMASQRIE